MFLSGQYYDQSMDEQGFKKVLDEALNPLREDIQCLKEDVSDLKEGIDSLKVSVVSLEQTVDSYADSYKENQRNIERLDTRLTSVEDKTDIIPPENLRVPHFAE